MGQVQPGGGPFSGSVPMLSLLNEGRARTKGQDVYPRRDKSRSSGPACSLSLCRYLSFLNVKLMSLGRTEGRINTGLWTENSIILGGAKATEHVP